MIDDLLLATLHISQTKRLDPIKMLSSRHNFLHNHIWFLVEFFRETLT